LLILAAKRGVDGQEPPSIGEFEEIIEVAGCWSGRNIFWFMHIPIEIFEKECADIFG